MSPADRPQPLPTWVTWQPRPFPDANLLLLHGREPGLVDSGFVGHAEQTASPCVWPGGAMSGIRPPRL